MEFGVTNLKDDRFYCIMHHLRVKQFHYPQKMLQIKKQFRYRACNEIGHNKKNKNCPLHPDHVELYFSESDEDN